MSGDIRKDGLHASGYYSKRVWDACVFQSPRRDTRFRVRGRKVEFKRPRGRRQAVIMFFIP